MPCLKSEVFALPVILPLLQGQLQHVLPGNAKTTDFGLGMLVGYLNESSFYEKFEYIILVIIAADYTGKQVNGSERVNISLFRHVKPDISKVVVTLLLHVGQLDAKDEC